jgi:hypothetical protein
MFRLNALPVLCITNLKVAHAIQITVQTPPKSASTFLLLEYTDVLLRASDAIF